jgi:murein DD-endopeptidase MepM/ murein hydrolase activator NlpD
MALRERSFRYDDADERGVWPPAQGCAARRFGLSGVTLWGAVAAASIFGCAVVASAAYLLFRDDMVAGLVERQAQMQYAYEDRLAAARLRLDQATSRQMLDQDSVEGKMQKLVMREAMLETRAAVVAQLVERASRDGAVEGVSQAQRTPAQQTAAKAPAPAAPKQASASEPAPQPISTKPQPEGLDLRLDGDRPAAKPTPAQKRRDEAMNETDEPQGSHTAAALANAADQDLPMPTRLANLALSMDRIEQDQAMRLSRIVKPALAAAGRLRRAFEVAGLPVERYMARARGAKAAGGVGGPFVPADAKAESVVAFERDLAAAQYAVGALDGLRRALPTVPLRKPLSGELQVTSTFGYRSDPFFGRPALHSGVDLREEWGQPVRATAGGTIVTAGSAGGYGNMVEVDHGGGLSTRYGHLSSVLVSAGQKVSPGAVIGKVGSTGRSTGPHLHYEVRAEGEAIDPSRFLRAAATLSASVQ